MGRRRKRTRGKSSRKKDPLLPSGQGDLLAETLFEVMGRKGASMEVNPEAGGQRGEDNAHPPPGVTNASDEGAPEGGSEPVPEAPERRESEALVPTTDEAQDSDEAEQDTIPDSAWERKLAWAKERVREGRREEALELYRELVEEDPSSVRAMNNLGILLDELGEHEEAVAHLTRGLALEPRNLEVSGNLGAALGALGKFAEAEDHLRRVLGQEPSNLEVRANLGILFFRRGLYGQAEAELGAVCRADPDHALAFYYRGEALNRLGRVDEAKGALERALELNPRNSKAYYTLGILLDKENRPEEAALMYRKARELVRK